MPSVFSYTKKKNECKKLCNGNYVLKVNTCMFGN